MTTVEKKQAVVRRVVHIVWACTIFAAVVLALRLLLRGLGASGEALFAAMIFGISAPMMVPFNGLIATPELGEVAFDTPALIAIVVYAAGGWLLTRLIRAVFRPSQAVTNE